MCTTNLLVFSVFWLYSARFSLYVDLMITLGMAKGLSKCFNRPEIKSTFLVTKCDPRFLSIFSHNILFNS